MSVKVALVDLDGTYIVGNTFHMWIKFILSAGTQILSTGDSFILCLRFYRLFVLRKLKILDHSRFKCKVQTLWHKSFSTDQIESLLCDFLQILQQRVSVYVTEKLISLRDESAIIILTTAAPEEYVQKLVEDNDFFHGYIATPSPASLITWYDNIRETKQRTTLDYLLIHDLSDKYLILFTDHIDDLYLMKYCHEIYLFPPVSHDVGSLSTRFNDKIFHTID